MSITRINNNVAALNANRNLAESDRALQKSIERLSSGLRINRAGDDAAGLTIATRLRSQVQGIDRAVMNAQDGINAITVAEGGMQEMTNRLDRIRVLAVQAANTGVNDLQARQALQDEVFQSIDEISRIADTTQFGTNRLLNGDFSVDAQIKPGQDGSQNFGINIDQGPTSNTLENGEHYLNIIQTRSGFQQLVPGLDDNGVTRTMHTGVRNATDIAVSLALFQDAALFGGSGVAGGTVISASAMNGVSVVSSDIVQFEGVLADGVTKYNGSLSTNAARDFDNLISQINASIDAAEIALFGVSSAASVPTAYRTTATLATSGANDGRIQLINSEQTFNQSDIDVRLLRGDTLVTQAKGTTRSGEIGANSILSGSGQVGNSVTAITGSTFTDGDFTISVEDVQGPQSRIVEGTVAFRNKTGALVSRTASLASATNGVTINGTFVDGVYTGGNSLSAGDTITLRGTEADGSTFVASYTLSSSGDTDTDLNDFQFASLSGLINELNYRTRDYTINALDGDLTRFESALFTLSTAGVLQLTDDLAREDSQLNFTMTFDDSETSAPAYTINDDAELVREGFTESATFRVNGGDPVRASAGDVITLEGPEATIDGEVQGQVTLRVGSGLAVGEDTLSVEGEEYVGRLNGGPEVTFQNGAQDVQFVSNGTNREGVARVLTLDFDNVLDITSSADTTNDPGTTVVISVVNRSMNFQIGAFAGQNFQTVIGDLSSENLGFGEGSGRTVNSIDVTTISGANEALRIVDEALDQINRTRSLLGAATNRLEGTIANLSIASENLTASESRIRDVDIAKETSNFTSEQIVLQAGTSVLAQANFLPQNFLQLLG